MTDYEIPGPDPGNQVRESSAPVFWVAICPLNRIEGIMRAEEIISRSGHIVDFHHFSDLEMSLVIEIPESNLDILRLELAGIMDVKASKGSLTGRDIERKLMISIAFSFGEGMHRNIVPAV